MLRPRRRGLASINSEVRDGILPAAGGLALTPSALPSGDGAVQRNYRTMALIIACALFMEQMDSTVLATALPTMARNFHVLAPAHERGPDLLSAGPGHLHPGQRLLGRPVRRRDGVPSGHRGVHRGLDRSAARPGTCRSWWGPGCSRAWAGP